MSEALSALPAAGSVATSALVPIVTIGSPNITQRATISQLAAGIGTAGFPSTVAVATGGTSGNDVVNYSQFNPTLGNPWVLHFPGGITMQGGNQLTSGGSGTVVFPYAFSDLYWSFTANSLGGSAPQISFIQINSVTFTEAGTVIFWMAVGPT
jgi:hypothetical protein